MVSKNAMITSLYALRYMIDFYAHTSHLIPGELIYILDFNYLNIIDPMHFLYDIQMLSPFLAAKSILKWVFLSGDN